MVKFQSQNPDLAGQLGAVVLPDLIQLVVIDVLQIQQIRGPAQPYPSKIPSTNRRNSSSISVKNLAWSPRRRSKSSSSRPSRGLGGASSDRSRSHHLRAFTLNIRRMNLDFFDRSSCKLDENHDVEFMS